MKRIVLVLVAFFLMAGTAFAEGVASPVAIFSNTQVVKGGTSVYALDMTKGEFAEAQIWNVQYALATPYYTAFSGATVPPIKWAISNYMPAGLSENDINKAFTGTKLREQFEWNQVIPSNIVHTAGATRYIWQFKPEAGKYMFLKADNNGVTDFRLTAYLGMAKFGSVPSLKLATLTFNLTSTTGTSSFAGTDSDGYSIPEGTRCLILENTSQSGVTVMHNNAAVSPLGTENHKSIPGADSYIYTGSLKQLQDIRVRALGTVTLKADCLNAYPFAR